MIKDIVVKLSVGERASPAEDYAVSVAATFNAHVTGIAFLYYPIVPAADAGYTLADIYGSRSGAGNIPPEMIETLQLDNAAATKAAIDRFATASARAGVWPNRSRPVPISPAPATSSAALLATSISPLSGKPNPRQARLKIRSSKPPCSIRAGQQLSCPTSRKRPSSSTASWCAGTVAGRRRARLLMPCRPLSGRACRGCHYRRQRTRQTVRNRRR